MRFRSFIIAYALVLAILLFADRRPSPASQNTYSRVVDLTEGSATQIISPAALIPGTWAAGQIPADRLIAPLAVMNMNSAGQLTVDDIASWETAHGNVPQGAIVAVRGAEPARFPLTADAAQFLMDARFTIGFILATQAPLESDRTLARQLALHGSYVVQNSAGMTKLPETGSLVIIAPTRSTKAATAPVRVLAMVR